VNELIRVGKRNLPWHEGMTVSDLLKEMGDPYPYPVVRIKEKDNHPTLF